MRLIDEILSDTNIDRAILQVKRNKGVNVSRKVLLPRPVAKKEDKKDENKEA